MDCTLMAQQSSKAGSAVAEVPELDQWQGSSLGIRIIQQDGNLAIDQMHGYAADQSSLKPGDVLLQLNETELSWDTRQRLVDLLAETEPDCEMEAVIERQGERKTLKVGTFRKEMVDIPEIIDRLKSNKIIKAHLESTDRGGFLDDLSERMVNAVSASKSPRQAAEAINAIIDEIDVSHTSILPTQSYNQLSGGRSGDLGLTIQRHLIGDVNRYFVIDRMPGSCGFDAEIKLGDEIVAINGMPIEQSRRLILSGQEHRRGLFFIQVEIGESVSIDYRRRQNGGVLQADLQAREAVPAENVIELSARVIESGKNQYGYIRFWNLMSMKTPSLVRGVIDNQFESCDMLILDLRGRGGLIPAVVAMDKLIGGMDVPVIAITDDLTRSAKEMLSLLIKKHDHVTVVGQKTAGAVVGATMTRLPSGNGFMYPVLSSESLKRFTDGVVIEGIGVEPDIEFDFQIPWCGGNDRLLEGAIETADEQIREYLKSIIRE